MYRDETATLSGRIFKPMANSAKKLHFCLSKLLKMERTQGNETARTNQSPADKENQRCPFYMKFKMLMKIG
jgi:hypothetical protein